MIQVVLTTIRLQASGLLLFTSSSNTSSARQAGLWRLFCF